MIKKLLCVLLMITTVITFSGCETTSADGGAGYLNTNNPSQVNSTTGTNASETWDNGIPKTFKHYSNSDEYAVVYPDEKGYYEAYGELYRLYLRDGSIVRSQTYESGFPIYIEDYSGNKVMVVDRGDYAYFVDEANQTITFLTMMGESIFFDNQPLNNPTKYYLLKNDILLLDKDTVGINPSKMPEIRKEIFSLYKDIELKPFSLNLFTEDFNSMKEYLSKEYEFNVYECTDISMNTLDRSLLKKRMIHT